VYYNDQTENRYTLIHNFESAPGNAELQLGSKENNMPCRAGARRSQMVII